MKARAFILVGFGLGLVLLVPSLSRLGALNIVAGLTVRAIMLGQPSAIPQSTLLDPMLSYAQSGSPTKAAAYLWSAHLAHLQGATTAERTFLQQAMDSNPANSITAVEWAALLLGQGERSQVVEVLHQVEHSENLFLIRAHQIVRTAGWAAASEDFRLAVEIRPDSAQAQEGWAQAQLYGLQDAVGAIHSYQQAIALGFNTAYLYVQLAQAQLIAGRDDEALQTLDYLGVRGEDQALAYAIRGDISLKRGQVALALASLQQAVRLAPNNPWFLVAYGHALCRAGQPKEAVGAWLAAMQAQPNFGPAIDARCDK